MNSKTFGYTLECLNNIFLGNEHAEIIDSETIFPEKGVSYYKYKIQERLNHRKLSVVKKVLNTVFSWVES